MSVYLNAVRTHTKKIHAELGVPNRPATVGLAQQLNVVGRRKPPRPKHARWTRRFGSPGNSRHCAYETLLGRRSPCLM